MKNNFTLILMWLLYIFSSNTKEQTQFWGEAFKFTKIRIKDQVFN